MTAFAGESPEARPITVLIVEDEPILRTLTADELRSRHYKVLEAGTAIEGAKILRTTGGVDVIFADINLPGVMGGLSFAVWLRERHPEIPIILTSGVKSIGPAIKGAGRVPFVPKPYDLDQLATLIHDVVLQPGKPR